MSVGFAATTQTSDDFIKNYFKQKKNQRDEFKYQEEQLGHKISDRKFINSFPMKLDLLLNQLRATHHHLY